MPDIQSKAKSIVIYTDGGCRNNPGAGGYGVVLLYKEHRKELSGGFALTTNNRMEISAAIAGLQALKESCSVTLYSDSKYLVDSVMQGWAKKWQAKGWRRNKNQLTKNADLWVVLLELCEQHEVNFKWVKGHAGDKENERCDELANLAIEQENLPDDEGYLNLEEAMQKVKGTAEATLGLFV